jgi:hypothetical protein
LFTTTKPNTESRNNTVFGVLELKLHAASYDWRFAAAAGGSWDDAGRQSCH